MARHKKLILSPLNEAQYVIRGLTGLKEINSDIEREWADMSPQQRIDEISSHKECVDDYAKDARKVTAAVGVAVKALEAAKAALAVAKVAAKLAEKTKPLVSVQRSWLKSMQSRYDEPTTYVETPKHKRKK